jgi:hypothetical protein
MLNQRAGLITVSLAVALIIITQTFAVVPASATAQCPALDFEGATAGSTNFNTAKSQMWHNDGIWWGVFTDNNIGIHFYSFSSTGATKGSIIDASTTGIPDTLWDGTNLYVTIWKSVSLATLYKFTYNSTTKTYTPAAGFSIGVGVPIALNGSATAALVIAKDSTGKLWATYTGTQGGLSDGTVRVIWSTSVDHTAWNTTGFTVETGLAPNILEISTLVHFQGNKIGVAWSDQPGMEIGFRFHNDGDPETTWSSKEVIDAGVGPRGLGPVSDDHLAIKAHPDGRIFLVAKDNDNDGTPAHATEGRIWLYVRTAAGVWGQKTNIQPDFSQLPTRPSLLLDVPNDRAYVIYHDESPSGAGRNFIAHTSMTGTPFFDFPCVFNLTASSNPTTTKQNITASMGLMAVASTGNTGSGELLFRQVALLQMQNPIPDITNLAPPSGTAGGAGFTLTVNGNNFINSSVVQWNGSDRTTTFVNANQLTASISAADIASAGTASVTVFNPAPGGGVSNAMNFAINNPAPTVANISPTTKIVGDVAFTLTVNGTNFVNTSIVRFNGSDRPTTFVNSIQVTAAITAADVATAGTFPITVFNPAPGGGLSGAVNLTVNNPVPTLGSISPPTKTLNDPAFVLTVNGTNFISGSVVRISGNNRTTTFINSTQLSAQITAADLQTAGTFPITVFNPTPGGGLSNAINLTVNNPAPSPGSLSPSSATAGGPAFTLTVNGTGFIPTSVVTWNGANRTTTFVNSTQLTASILAADIAAQGTAQVRVVNPAPGGGTSAPLNFTINGVVSCGWESDVAPRPNGSNTGFITLSDWTQTGRFSAGLDTPAVGCEFQRADAAGRTTLGNGAITVSDWVQAGRYAAGLDPPTAAGGPNGSAPIQLKPLTYQIDAVDAERIVRAAGNPMNAGQAATVNIELDSQGDENALGFSVTFDQAKLTYVSATLGTGATGVTLNVNAAQVGSGRLGIAMAQSAGGTFTAGTRQLLVLTFNVAPSASGSTVIGFGDQPVFREISDPAVNILPATYASATLSITPISNPVPSIASLSPSSTLAGGAAFTLTVNGSNFVSGSIVRWNGVDLSTTFVNAGQLTAQVTAAHILTAGTVAITVSSPGTPLIVSNVFNFNVTNPTPSANGVSPTSALVGGSAFTLTVNGSHFVNGSVITWNGDNRTTTFVNSTQLTTQIPATDLLTAGVATVAVVNPGPGGGTSSNINFSLNNPAPSPTSLSPANAVAGGGAFTLTVNGSNFVSSSIVRWNGVARPTTFVNSTQLTIQITAADIAAVGSPAVTVVNPTPGGGTSSALTFSILPAPPKLEFNAASFNISEGGGSAVVTVSRTGDSSGTAAVGFAISDPIAAINCSAVNGVAGQNCDYTIAAGVLAFNAGETSKTFTIPIVEDAYMEGNENFNLKLENATGAGLGTRTTTVVTILDNDTTQPTTNPIDHARTFVRQHYLDFLSREPDSGGLDYWTDQINQCGTDLTCIRSRRIGVSGAFFVELEFQRTGSVVYRLHKASYGTRPSYAQFMPDRSQLVDGPQLPATTLAFANTFVRRPEFLVAYPDSMTAAAYVNKLYDTAQVMNNPVQRQQAIDALIAGTKTRAQVLLDLTEINEFKQREYNPSFVLMQYFGYLRRDPDQGGYDFWVDIINNREPNNYPAMICAFLTSAEYQQRFSAVVTSFNSQCGP